MGSNEADSNIIKQLESIASLSDEYSLLIGLLIANTTIYILITEIFGKATYGDMSVWKYKGSLLAATATGSMTIRYLHGNSAWVKWSNLQRRTAEQDVKTFLARFLPFTFHVVQYCLFAATAYTVLFPQKFMNYIIAISILDILWTFISYISERNNNLMSQALGFWCVLSLITGSLAATAKWVLHEPSKNPEALGQTVLAVLSICLLVLGVISYYRLRWLFFGAATKTTSDP